MSAKRDRVERLKRLVVVATDAWGGVWVNPDALNGTKWQPLTPEAVEPEPQPSA